MRPFYENDKDRKNEFAVAQAVAAYWGLNAVKLKPACEVDFAITQFDDVLAVMEVKCRNYYYDEIDRFGGLMLSCHKMSAIRRWHTDFPIGIVIAVRLNDGIFTFTTPKGYDLQRFPKIKMTGRRDRNDTQDIEPCVLIPMNNFRKLLDVETISE
jgi:hypothetical protein